MLKTTYVLTMTIQVQRAEPLHIHEEFDHHPTQNEVVKTMWEHKAISSYVTIRYDLVEEPKPQKVRLNARALIETAITEHIYRFGKRPSAIFMASDVHQEMVDDINHIRALGNAPAKTMVQYDGIDIYEVPKLPSGKVMVSL
jgi:hypothetical protein